MSASLGINVIAHSSLFKEYNFLAFLKIRISLFCPHPPVPLLLPIILQRSVAWQCNFILISVPWEVANPDWDP